MSILFASGKTILKSKGSKQDSCMHISADDKKKKRMPDVAKSTISQHNSTLDWVGMSQISLPMRIQQEQLQENCNQYLHSFEQTVHAKVETYVSLNNTEIKGIHMSRLYLLLTEYAESHVLSIQTLKDFLKSLLQSHQNISDKARIKFEFDYLIKQPALKSQHSGWKSYRTSIMAEHKEETTIELEVSVPYSSTCPCSAALARQLIQEQFSKDFFDQNEISKASVESWLHSDKGTYATPHSQRSTATVLVKLDESELFFQISKLIEKIESTLKTAVQTAVKREDEQEFARLNGHNLMFCEDAARRLKTMLTDCEYYQDFKLKVEHFESLHAHDAVSIATKGVIGGYTA